MDTLISVITIFLGIWIAGWTIVGLFKLVSCGSMEGFKEGWTWPLMILLLLD